MIEVGLLHVDGVLLVDAVASLGEAEWGRGIRLSEPPNRRTLDKG